MITIANNNNDTLNDDHNDYETDYDNIDDDNDDAFKSIILIYEIRISWKSITFI